ncbi:phospholipase [Rhodobacteraceae bacterium 2CG4]|uniref:Phospholipase n=1 Tax=Halovulum marinum TaxID=2662447 RepID=A0A6L5Z2V2_9RHOB|nr:luciferase family protein [Halovulum marinum]MSU90903.1 phospholipase [Halovulum marinum]
MKLRRYSAFLLAAALPVVALADALPQRSTPAPRTTNSVPHVQLGVEPVPALSAELLKRVALLPGVKIGPTMVSLPGAAGFQIEDDMPLARPEVITGGREFAHLHPDGSLHASLPPDLAQEAVRAGWAVSHPWSTQRDGWDGYVMIFTPTSDQELVVVQELVTASFEFVTGRDAGSK